MKYSNQPSKFFFNRDQASTKLVKERVSQRERLDRAIKLERGKERALEMRKVPLLLSAIAVGLQCCCLCFRCGASLLLPL